MEEASVVGEEEGIEEVVDVVAQKQETRAIRPLQRLTVEEVHTDRIQNQGEAVLLALEVEARALEGVALAKSWPLSTSNGYVQPALWHVNLRLVWAGCPQQCPFSVSSSIQPLLLIGCCHCW